MVANSAFTRRKAACSTTFICGFDCVDVKVLDYGIEYAYWIIFRDKVTDAVRKKKIIVLIVRSIYSRGRMVVIVGGAGVSEANGVLRNHYHPPGATIYIEKRLTNQSYRLF